MTGTLVGYFLKRKVARATWASVWPGYPDAAFPAAEPVEEICSVSGCIAGWPDLQPTDAPFNPFGGYDRPESAWAAFAPGQPYDYLLYAYRLAPLLFRDGQARPLDLPELDVRPLPGTFERLGYDAVELSEGGPSWGCSPLSCNGATDGATLNRHCLVATEPEGIKLAHVFSVSKPEPGPYGLVEVWRDAAGPRNL